MRVAQFSWSKNAGWAASSSKADRDLVFFFGTRQALACGSRYHELRAMFPHAHIVGCSTGGQIHNDDVTDDEIAAAALGFDATGCGSPASRRPPPNARAHAARRSAAR